MIRTCEGHRNAAKEIIAAFRDGLVDLSTNHSGDELTVKIKELCDSIDEASQRNRMFVHAVAMELDTFYRQMLGETYSKADLMIYLNQQKNDIQDRFSAIMQYPNVFNNAHEQIHLFYCQDPA